MVEDLITETISTRKRDRQLWTTGSSVTLWIGDEVNKSAKLGFSQAGCVMHVAVDGSQGAVGYVSCRSDLDTVYEAARGVTKSTNRDF